MRTELASTCRQAPGEGSVSFRREAHVPRRGPDGGDGGRAADVVVVCDGSLRDLRAQLSRRPRMAFFVTAVRPPPYRRSTEDYVVEELDPGRCRFTWTLAFELTWLGRLNGPLTALIVRRMFADTRRHFEQLASEA
jgi:hypothetical protein